MDDLFAALGIEVVSRKSWYAEVPATMAKAFAAAHTRCSAQPNTYRIYANVPGGTGIHHTVKVPATVDKSTGKITKPARTDVITNADYFALQVKTYADMHDVAYSATVDGGTVGFRFASHRDKSAVDTRTVTTTTVAERAAGTETAANAAAANAAANAAKIAANAA
jgi:hypothetical protein